MVTSIEPDLLENLKAMDTAALDDLPFGVIGMAPGAPLSVTMSPKAVCPA